MSAYDTENFRSLCGRFRWLAIFMVVGVGGFIAFLALLPPVVEAFGQKFPGSAKYRLAFLASALPTICYLFGVWSIGQAMGEVARGRLIQAALPSALRRVGISLAAGGVISVFVVSNLVRLVGLGKGGYLHFDVAGMTLGMIGGALFLLGRVMDQALAVQAELDEMI